ncbi:sulfatase-like hydrolase/transferase [Xenorhabdus sp. 42]|nr:sulfatase-like hydrolase/transferase [Xenorhabdus sp. 42]MBD2820335.1 sulfatase-like hydrolase/transferase [Xenorhabdus sp. 42]
MKKTKWYNHDNIIDIVKAAGYKTSWVSNQNINGEFGNAISVFANRANYLFFNFKGGSSDLFDGYYDEDLLSDKVTPIIDSDKSFIVYHLSGTHNSYENRYPKPKFNHFHSDNYPNNKYNPRNEANYDNAILYNDFVISKIINKYKNDDSLIIYPTMPKKYTT